MLNFSLLRSRENFVPHLIFKKLYTSTRTVILTVNQDKLKIKIIEKNLIETSSNQLIQLVLNKIIALLIICKITQNNEINVY